MTQPQELALPDELAAALSSLAKRGHYDSGTSDAARLVVPAFLASQGNLATMSDSTVAQHLITPGDAQEALLRLMQNGTNHHHLDDLSGCYAAALAVARPEGVTTLSYGADDSGFYLGPFHPSKLGCYIYFPIAAANEGLGQYLEYTWLPTPTGSLITLSGMSVYSEERRQVCELEQRACQQMLILRRWTTLVLDRSAGLTEALVPAELAAYYLASWIGQLFRGIAVDELKLPAYAGSAPTKPSWFRRGPFLVWSIARCGAGTGRPIAA